MKNLILLLAVVIQTKNSASDRIFRDPALINRIPLDLRNKIDLIVANKLDELTLTHFKNDEAKILNTNILHESSSLVRERRQVDSTNVYSQWGEYSPCSAKCGGGLKTRTRVCLQGNCALNTTLTESLECGNLPCVTGTFILDSISPYSNLIVSGFKYAKFFQLYGVSMVGFITEENLYVMNWDQTSATFLTKQTIPVSGGVAFDLFITSQLSYLVVLEKSPNVFPGTFSKIYIFNPFTSEFDVTQPLTFDVWDPSALATFNVYGTPFLVVVNYQDRLSIDNGHEKEVVICDGATKVITCPPGFTISVASATYGRTNQQSCASDLSFMLMDTYYSYCVVAGINYIVGKICNNQESCSLTATPSQLAPDDPCIQIKKYLTVLYTCNRISYITKPTFYKWDGVGLSLTPGENLFTAGALDIEAFTIHNIQYIAVANFINDQSINHLDSEVYIYNLFTSRFQSFQKLRTDGAVDWEFFSIGEGVSTEFFLAVANFVKVLPNGQKKYDIDSVIYKWSWNLFVPFQCVKTYGAKKWTAIKGKNGEFVLSIANLYGNITFYNYDGWRFYPSRVQPEGRIFQNVEAVYQSTSDHTIFLVKNNVQENLTVSNIYQTTFMQTFPKYDLLENTIQAVQKMNQSLYYEFLPQVEAFNASFNLAKDTFIHIDRDINLTGSKTFTNMTFISGVLFDTVTVDSIVLSPINKLILNMEVDLKNLIDIQSENITALNTLLNQVVTKSTDQTIVGQKSFSTVTVSKLTVENDININGLINNIDLSEKNSQLLFVDMNATLLNDILFANDVIINSNINSKFINNISTSDLIAIDRSDEIHGEKTFLVDIEFSSDENAGLVVEGLINGINLTNALTTQSNQTITSSYVIDGITTFYADINVQGNVNNIDLSNVAADTLFINKVDQLITSQKTFDAIKINGDLIMNDGAEINGVDISELWKFSQSVKNFENLETVVFYHNVSFGNVYLHGKLNGRNLSDILYTYLPSTVSGKISFLENVYLQKNIVVDGKVNGIDISGNVLKTNGVQTINGKKEFQSGILVLGDLISNGLVDNINISEAFENTMLNGVEQNVKGYMEFDTLSATSIQLNQCEYDCLLLNILQNISSNTVRHSSSPQIIKGSVIFVTDLNISKNATVKGYINGVHLPDDLLIQGKDQIVSGLSHFLSNITVAGNATVKTINFVNISDLFKNALRKSGEQDVTGIKTFIDTVSFSSTVDNTGTIDGVYTNNLVLSEVDQIVNGSKTFTAETSIDTLNVGSIIVDGFIDGVNLTFLHSELVNLSASQIIKGTKIFESHVSFNGNFTIDGLIDGVNLTDLAANAMRISGNQVVTGVKTFNNEVNVNNIMTVSGLVDNVNLENFVHEAVYINDNMTLDKELMLKNISLTGNLILNGLYNDCNLTELFRDTLMSIGDQVVTGNITIEQLISRNMSGEVNDLDFKNEVVFLDEQTNITGSKIFLNTVLFNSLNVSNTINGVILREFANNGLYLNQDANITGQLKFTESVNIYGDLNIQGLLNGINIFELYRTTLKKNSDQNVSVKTHFSNAIFLNNVYAGILLDNIDIVSLNENAVYKCLGPNKVVQNSINFTTIKSQESVVCKNLNLQGNLNGININQLNDEIVTLYGNHTITGSIEFIGDVNAVNVTTRSVNGFLVPEDFVLLNHNQTINGYKIIADDVFVYGDFNIEKFKNINSIDFSEFAQSIVTLDGNETINSEVEFEENIIITSNLNTSTINSVEINSINLMVQNQDQVVSGKKVFTNISVEKEIISQNLNNGLNFSLMNEEIVLSGRRNQIIGSKTLHGNVTIQGNLVTNLINGINITNLFSGYNKIALLEVSLNMFNKSIISQQIMTSELVSSVKNVQKNLEYFTELDQIRLAYMSVSIAFFVENGDVYLVAGALNDVDQKTCINSSVFIMSKETKKFSKKYEILTNAITDIYIVNSNEGSLMFTSSNKPDKCLQTSYFNRFYTLTSKNAKLENTFGMYPSTNFDISISNGSFTMLSTSSYNTSTMSPCVGQQFFVNESITISIPSCNAVKSIILSSNTIYTVAILSESLYGGSLAIYDIFEDSSFILRQNISTDYAEDVIQFTTSEGDFIAIANSYDSSSSAIEMSYTVPVTVLKLSSNGLYAFYQNIYVAGAMKLRYFESGVYSYLAVASFNQQIVILKHNGFAKWNVEFTIPVQGYNSIKDMVFWNVGDELFAAFLANNLWDSAYPSVIKIVQANYSSDVDGSMFV
ncbi:uncharacterized protein LOC101236068 [Hydra vulgaris]|uniref:uncharacterized protein LOC101236068 n=1 Tax=Hydra vulgaris TaxID=6087 RepID=UPI0032E9CD8C